MSGSIDALTAELTASLGAASVLTDLAARRSYDCDGLTQYRVTPALVVLAADAAAIQTAVAACARHGGALGRARLGHRVVGRLDAARRRRGDRDLAAAPHRRGRPGQPARGGRARRHQPRHHAGRGAVRAVLRARPVQPAGLLDRRQRGRELRWRALPEVRVHDQPRDRPLARPAVRRSGRARRQGARVPRLRPGRHLRRIRGHARHRHLGDGAAHPRARDGADRAGRVPLDRCRPRRPCRRSSRRVCCRPRSR